MVQFKKYEAKDNWNNLGTVKANAGKGGKIGFMKRNFANKEKSVAILLTNKAGESAVIPLQKDLSNLVREGKVKLSHLVGFEIIESKEIREGFEEPTRLVVAPSTGGVMEVAIDSIKQEAYDSEEEESFLPEGLIAL